MENVSFIVIWISLLNLKKSICQFCLTWEERSHLFRTDRISTPAARVREVTQSLTLWSGFWMFDLLLKSVCFSVRGDVRYDFVWVPGARV